MNTESLEQIKKELKRKKDLRLKLCKVEERLEKLKETKEVKEYLALKELDTEENRQLLSEEEEEMESKTINKYLNNDAIDGEIYYCVGKDFNAYETNKRYYILNIKSYGAIKVALYKSLESFHQVIIEVGKEEKFEKENKVILSSTPTIEEFHKIQREYFEKALNTDVTESRNYILGKYRQKE